MITQQRSRSTASSIESRSSLYGMCLGTGRLKIQHYIMHTGQGDAELEVTENGLL